ncbi:cadherin-like protein 26 [Eucyclogobius newberryi]|uniref:cadherin-like protein 26 n=1 Tax=Eucyclogobius newberryi TaxID=166745 RepID=UPI003B58B982
MLRFIVTVYLLSSAACSPLQSRHKRAWIIDSFIMEENHPGPFPYELGKIYIERAYRVNFDLYGEGVDQDPKGVLTVDKETGIIYVHKPVDFEEKDLLTLHFETKKSDFSLDTKLGVQITITDINDNPPLFQKNLYEITTQEETAQGYFLLTVSSYDRDQRGSPNSTFHYQLKSVSPQTDTTQFFVDRETGKISFKGCLDHEVADKFTLLVEAKDHGDVISLSSSTTVVISIQDGNNHLPIISGQTGSGKVKEGETGTSPLRIQVTDRDTPNSPASRVKYTISGADAQHFQIETDPETNNGILTVITPLDYEEFTKHYLTISVENEAPFFCCTVKEKTVSGLWRVDMSSGEETTSFQSQTVNVSIEVEDVNDPPAFLVTVKEAMVEENSPVGTWVEKVTAHDPDSSHAREFVYRVGDDPAGWVKVDPKTGDITTIQTLDRESPHVVKDIYTVLMYAVDNGEPPMTGSATVNIHVADQNDNVPELEVDIVDVCVSDDITTTNITAFDLDANPFGGPFTFELLEDVEDKWRLDPSYGYTAGLVKESAVFVGQHKVSVKVSDMQGQSGIYSLGVIVCDCSLSPNCRLRREKSIATGAVGFMFLAPLLFIAGLMLAVFLTCKKQFTAIQLPDSKGTTLASHMEGPGTDCKVQEMLHTFLLHDLIYTNMNMEQKTMDTHYNEYSKQHFSQHFHHHGNEWITYSDKTIGEHLYKQQMSREAHFRLNSNSERVWNEAILTLCERRLILLQETEDELLQYKPHIYSEEGDEDSPSELDDISIPENESFHSVLHNLSPEFNNLASICQMHLRC